VNVVYEGKLRETVLAGRHLKRGEIVTVDDAQGKLLIESSPCREVPTEVEFQPLPMVTAPPVEIVEPTTIVEPEPEKAPKKSKRKEGDE